MHGDDKVLGGSGKRRRSIGRELKMIMCICMKICQSLAGRFLLYSMYVHSNDLGFKIKGLRISLGLDSVLEEHSLFIFSMCEGKEFMQCTGTKKTST